MKKLGVFQEHPIFLRPLFLKKYPPTGLVRGHHPAEIYAAPAHRPSGGHRRHAAGHCAGGHSEPQAEWGSMINQARAYIQLNPWPVLAPAAATVLTVMLLNRLGDCVRDCAAVEERV